MSRLATQIAHILRGKHKPTFTKNFDCGDYVVVVNAREVKFTGKKLVDKKYTWHTGFPGGLKQKSPKDYLSSRPEEVGVSLPSLFLTCSGAGAAEGRDGHVRQEQPAASHRREAQVRLRLPALSITCLGSTPGRSTCTPTSSLRTRPPYSDPSQARKAHQAC